MLLGILVLSASLQASNPAACAPAADSWSLEQCRGDRDVTAAQGAPKGSVEQQQHWQLAAGHYRKALDSTASGEIKARLLGLIADLYDKPALDDLGQLDGALRELIRYAGSDLKPTFRLAKVEEDRGALDDAEATLQAARRQQPDDVEPYKVLAQFYARRATTMQQATTAKENAAKNPTPSGRPDEDGFYHVGGEVAAPRKVGNAVYPPEAQAAGINGAVGIEITLNEQGIITDAKVVGSVPLLDDAALKAVREWRYDPVVVNGKPVPAKMLTTVNFTLR